MASKLLLLVAVTLVLCIITTTGCHHYARPIVLDSVVANLPDSVLAKFPGSILTELEHPLYEDLNAELPPRPSNAKRLSSLESGFQDVKNGQSKQLSSLESAKQLSSLESGFQELKNGQCIKEVKEEVVRQSITRRDCSDVLASGITASGLYEVNPNPSSPATMVYCDQETEGGGWTVIQRRENNKIREDFYRTWREYRSGFGEISGEFWLGNDIIHHLTNIKLTELRMDLEDYNCNHRWAKYGTFYVDNELNKYKLTAKRYSGNAGDALRHHDGEAFSTYDSDNDSYGRNCAELCKGGWWYKGCHHANLNGLPYIGEHKSNADGINYYQWLGNKYSLKKTTMMIRPVVRVHE